MNAVNCVSEWSRASDLERVVEPLANYICATEQPRAALLSALAALRRQVRATNGTASVHFRHVLGPNS